MAVLDRKLKRQKRKIRIRKKVSGSAKKPRLAVYRSNKHITAQIILDDEQKTVCAISSYSPDFKGKVKGSDKSGAEVIGKAIGEKALELGFKEVVFDRGGYQYHGRIKALAESARKAGLKF